MQEELVALWEKTRLSTLYVTHNIQEAVLLADRVILLSRRPGRVSNIIEIGIPRLERERSNIPVLSTNMSGQSGSISARMRGLLC
jgi:ABC-type nitrate/sulfonate/bicarbonate transport system ATPase subunit